MGNRKCHARVHSVRMIRWGLTFPGRFQLWARISPMQTSLEKNDWVVILSTTIALSQKTEKVEGEKNLMNWKWKAGMQLITSEKTE